MLTFDGVTAGTNADGSDPTPAPSPSSSGGSGSAWTGLINQGTLTGLANLVASFKGNPAGYSVAPAAATTTPASNNTLWYIIAAVVVVVLLYMFMVKKGK